MQLHTDDIDEHGGLAALRGQSADTDVTFSTLGLRGEHRPAWGGGLLALQGMVGWRHASGDKKPAADLAFAAGRDFSVEGVPLAKDSMLIQTGIEAAPIGPVSLGLSYTGQLSGSAHDHGFTGHLALRF
ncbi:outer membrane autotransporter barrel domain-containing protein [Arboricoccus pini]|uniref:Outer membrane autotransporter barrel domain-containing protein n=1 Tax=Arboricoccus pini TaxID=1963835 RepID=A0A212RDC0_9PROT|nr:outer membrane autotransporter barrel domain-containing protein [Arboricoccus pini]